MSWHKKCRGASFDGDALSEWEKSRSSAWNRSLTASADRFVRVVRRAMIRTKLKRQIDAELQKWKLLSSVQCVILLKRPQISHLIPTEGVMKALESVKNHSSHTRVPPSASEPLRVSEAENWQVYYEHPDGSV